MGGERESGSREEIEATEGLATRGAYVDRLALPEGHVKVLQGEGDRVQGCPAWIAPVFIPRCDDKRGAGVIAAGLHQGVIAAALEVVQPPVKHGVMRISVDVAKGCLGRVAAPLAILDLANLLRVAG